MTISEYGCQGSRISAKIEMTETLAIEIAMKPNIEIYTWQSCPFCIKAKALLNRKGVEFTEYAIDGDNQARDKMSERTNGKRSLPQIFIDDQYIGGCDDIHALEASGKLDTILAIN